MTLHNILFIGLNTHKEFVDVAYIEDNREAKPIHFGHISSAKTAIKKLIRQFESKYSSATVHFVLWMYFWHFHIPNLSSQSKSPILSTRSDLLSD